MHYAVNSPCIYSKSVFDSQHGLKCPDAALASKDSTLTLAQWSRVEVLQLFKWYDKSGVMCSLELDLLGPGLKMPTSSTSYYEQDPPLPNLTFDLYEHINIVSLDLIQKFTVDIIPKQKTGMYGESYKPNLENMGKYNVESLATLLNMNRLSRIQSGGKHISLDEKFKLAYKTVEMIIYGLLRKY